MRDITWIALVVVVGCAQPDPVSPDATTTPVDATTTIPDASATAPAITVLTVNLRTALLDGDDVDERTAIVVDLITATAPDVVALQEVTESASLPNRAAVIADATDYAFVWEPTHDLVVGDEGIAVLGRGTITWHAAAALPHVEFGALHRAVLGARVATPDGPVELFATHLTVGGSATERADQAVAALAHARANHAPEVPAFFAGDLNAEPDELAMRVLRGDASHDGVTGDLVDAWPTVSTAPGFTIPSDAPDRRIDYVYAMPGAGAASSCETVLGDPVDGVLASDHLGVLCRFAR
jgi:endonuclease/exonuclease/phosphatase family metal-dependent hydrolase